MIKELEDKYEFYPGDPLLDKYFFNVKLTKNEMKKMKEVYKYVKKFIQKTKLSKDLSYKPYALISPSYLDNYGYYELIDVDRGYFDLIPLGEDGDKVISYSIYKMLSMLSHDYEFKSRKELEIDFNNRFGNFNFMPLYDLESNRYFQCLYFAEYAIDKWNMFFDDNIPGQIIKHYEDYLNNIWWSKEQGVIWKYDIDNKKFDCQKNVKVRKLEK